ncbi:MAG: hypothetical protein EA425_04470 [Puniceicoccaceae bacterium]|nr:MAG: hypothetical protein EA425_04470 [Puniceicoccaceae bacterium]
MLDLIKKTMLAGVGAAVLTKEKAEAALNELVEKGKISAEEARETAARISEDGKKEFDSASKALQKRIEKLVDQVSGKNRERIDLLEARVAALEAHLEDSKTSGTKKSSKSDS